MSGEEVLSVEFVEPLRGEPPVLCTHCGEEIEAWAYYEASLWIHGTAPYMWRHVGTGTEECVVARRCRPYDDFDAYRQIEMGRDREAKRAAEGVS